MSDAQSFHDFVDEQRLDAETLFQAERYYLAELLDHPDPEVLLAELAEEVDDVHDLTARLQRDALLLENAALCVLSAAWRDPAEQPRVRRAVDGASVKLPVIDPTVVATYVLYGLHLLLRTAGRRETTVVKEPDGTTTTQMLDESGPLAVLLGAMHRRRTTPGPPPDPELEAAPEDGGR